MKKVLVVLLVCLTLLQLVASQTSTPAPNTDAMSSAAPSSAGGGQTTPNPPDAGTTAKPPTPTSGSTQVSAVLSILVSSVLMAVFARQ